MALNIIRKENGCFPKQNLGKYELSIQGSSTHYSTPRADLNSIDEYKNVEIAIFNAKTGEWINPHHEPDFKAFPLLDALLKRYENAAIPVGGQLDINLVEKLYDYLKDIK